MALRRIRENRVTQPSPIPLARADDEDQLLDLLRERHSEEGIGRFDAAKARATVRRGINREYSLIGIVRGRYAIEASVGLVVTSWWDSDTDVLSDLWCFTREPYRRSPHGRTLLAFSKWASLQLGTPLLATHITTPETKMRTVALTKEIGTPRAHLYLFDPAAPQEPAAAGVNREIRDRIAGRRRVAVMAVRA